MADENKNVKRIIGTSRVDIANKLDTQMLGYSGEADKEALAFKDASGNTKHFPAENSDANFKSMKLDDLAGTGNRNIGVDSNGKLIEYAIEDSGSTEIIGDKGIGFEDVSFIDLSWSDNIGGTDTFSATLTMTVNTDCAVKSLTNVVNLSAGDSFSVNITRSSLPSTITSPDECILYAFFDVDNTNNLIIKQDWDSNLPSIAVMVFAIKDDGTDVEQVAQVLNDTHGLDMSETTRDFINNRSAWMEKWGYYDIYYGKVARESCVYVNDDVKYDLPGAAPNETTPGALTSIMYVYQDKYIKCVPPTDKIVDVLYQDGFWQHNSYDGLTDSWYDGFHATPAYYIITRNDIRGTDYSTLILVGGSVASSNGNSTDWKKNRIQLALNSWGWFDDRYSSLWYDWHISALAFGTDSYNSYSQLMEVHNIFSNDTKLIENGSAFFGDILQPSDFTTPWIVEEEQGFLNALRYQAKEIFVSKPITVFKTTADIYPGSNIVVKGAKIYFDGDFTFDKSENLNLSSTVKFYNEVEFKDNANITVDYDISVYFSDIYCYNITADNIGAMSYTFYYRLHRRANEGYWNTSYDSTGLEWKDWQIDSSRTGTTPRYQVTMTFDLDGVSDGDYGAVEGTIFLQRDNNLGKNIISKIYVAKSDLDKNDCSEFLSAVSAGSYFYLNEEAFKVEQAYLTYNDTTYTFVVTPRETKYYYLSEVKLSNAGSGGSSSSEWHLQSFQTYTGELEVWQDNYLGVVVPGSTTGYIMPSIARADGILSILALQIEECKPGQDSRRLFYTIKGYNRTQDGDLTSKITKNYLPGIWTTLYSSEFDFAANNDNPEYYRSKSDIITNPHKIYEIVSGWNETDEIFIIVEFKQLSGDGNGAWAINPNNVRTALTITYVQ